MTNYNDGKWHEWAGGDCPVHPKSELEVIWKARGPDAEIKGATRAAGEFQYPCWSHAGSGKIQWFRVVKEYREPRVFWIKKAEGCGFSRIDDHEPEQPHDFIRVREVLE